MNNKKQRGQFYTVNYEYILQNLLDIIPFGSNIIEPFVGRGDLLKPFLSKNNNFYCYDIDDSNFHLIKNNDIKCLIKQDTFLNIPDYGDKYIITNPPYLNKNKSIDKIYFNKYNEDDLYKCAIKSFMNFNVLGGILIIPINFFSSIENNLLRKEFMEKFKIIKLNIFEEQVFPDTSYSVCSFSFILRNKIDMNTDINTIIYPLNKQLYLNYNIDNNWILANELYNKKKNKYKISRLKENEIPNTNLLVKCIDDNIQINMSISKNHYYGKNTDRSYLTLSIIPIVSEEIQLLICQKFNEKLNFYREKYHSLFLTNYRESNKNGGRKRINFELIYSIVSTILDEI